MKYQVKILKINNKYDIFKTYGRLLSDLKNNNTSQKINKMKVFNLLTGPEKSKLSNKIHKILKNCIVKNKSNELLTEGS